MHFSFNSISILFGALAVVSAAPTLDPRTSCSVPKDAVSIAVKSTTEEINGFFLDGLKDGTPTISKSSDFVGTFSKSEGTISFTDPTSEDCSTWYFTIDTSGSSSDSTYYPITYTTEPTTTSWTYTDTDWSPWTFYDTYYDSDYFYTCSWDDTWYFWYSTTDTWSDSWYDSEWCDTYDCSSCYWFYFYWDYEGSSSSFPFKA